MVPYESIVEKEGATKVFVVEDRVARLKDVTIGVDTALFTEILSGLSDGEKVIVSPPPGLSDGGSVTEVTNLPADKGGSDSL